MEYKWNKQCGERLRTIRKQRGLAMGKLCGKASISAAQLSRYERGEGNPSLAVLTQLAVALGCTAPYLLNAVDDPERYFPDGAFKRCEHGEPPQHCNECDADALERQQRRRDRFAAAALQGILANCYTAVNVEALVDNRAGRTLVDEAWAIADLMLEADK